MNSLSVADMARAIREALEECHGEQLVDRFLDELHSRGFMVVARPEFDEVSLLPHEVEKAPPGEPDSKDHESDVENHR